MTTTLDPRLAHLGVPAAFHAEILARRAPRFHILVHLAIVLASIAAAVVALAAWSRYAAASAKTAALTAHAILYDSDIGAESLGLLLTVLLAAGWLCGLVTWRRGSEGARNGWAADLRHQPAKNKAITDWLWRQMIRRHTKSALNGDDFLDRLGAGMVRDLWTAALAMLVITAALGLAWPARVSFVTDTAVTDISLLPFGQSAVHSLATAAAVVSGCPKLPKDGNTLVYWLRFADGAEATVSAWSPLMGSRLAALETLAARLPAGAARLRFSNPIQSAPISPECVAAIGKAEGADGVARLMRLLTLTDAEQKGLAGVN